MPDPRLFWRRMPDARATVTLPEFTIQVEHNSLGFRDSEWTMDPGPCARVLVLGDSFTWGWGVEVDETFAARLEALLSTDAACVEVLNFGVMAYGTSQEYLLWEEGARYQPDLVVVAFGFNDLANSRAHMNRVPGIAQLVGEGRDGQVAGETQLSYTPTDRIKGWLKKRSYIYHLATVVIKSNPTLRQLLLGSAAAGLIRPPDSPIILAGETAGHLAQLWLTLLRSSVHETGAQFLVVYVPFVEELDAVTVLGRDAKEWKEAAAFSSWLSSAEYLDLTPPLLEASKEGEPLYHLVDGHWASAGHKLAAGEIARHVVSFELPPIGNVP